MNPQPTKAPVQGLLYKMNSEVPTSSKADPLGQTEVKVIVHGQDNVTVKEKSSSPREEEGATTHQGYVNEGLETEEEDILSPHKIELDGFNVEGQSNNKYYIYSFKDNLPIIFNVLLYHVILGFTGRPQFS